MDSVLSFVVPDMSLSHDAAAADERDLPAASQEAAGPSQKDGEEKGTGKAFEGEESQLLFDISKDPWASEDEKGIGMLLLRCAQQERAKQRWMYQVVEDCQWSRSKLQEPYIARKWLLCQDDWMVNNNHSGLLLMSSGEWLNGLLLAGKLLEVSHVRILLCLVNPFLDLDSALSGPYIPASEWWSHQSFLTAKTRALLALLEKAVMNQQMVYIPTCP